METANYVRVLPGGHCMFCHKDYTEMAKEHPCFKEIEETYRKGRPTVCGEKCKDSKYKVQGVISNLLN